MSSSGSSVAAAWESSISPGSGDSIASWQSRCCRHRWTGRAAVGSAAASGAIGAAGLGLGLLAALPAIGIGAVIGAGTLGWYRWLYRRGLAKGTEELESLLLAIESRIRGQSLFGEALNPFRLPSP